MGDKCLHQTSEMKLENHVQEPWTKWKQAIDWTIKPKLYVPHKKETNKKREKQNNWFGFRIRIINTRKDLCVVQSFNAIDGKLKAFSRAIAMVMAVQILLTLNKE